MSPDENKDDSIANVPNIDKIQKKKFSCNYAGCGRSFTTSGHASRHYKIHLGVKPHCCPVKDCMAAFSRRRDNMRQHYSSHLRKEGVSEAEIQILVNEHNSRRKLHVQPQVHIHPNQVDAYIPSIYNHSSMQSITQTSLNQFYAEISELKSTSKQQDVDIDDFITGSLPQQTIATTASIFHNLRLEHSSDLLNNMISILDNAQQSHSAHIPASKFFSRNLPVCSNSIHSTCPICVVDFEFSSTDPRELPCKHAFHEACLLPWLKTYNTCPLCRLELPTDDAAYEKIRKQKAKENQTPGYESEEEYDPFYS